MLCFLLYVLVQIAACPSQFFLQNATCSHFFLPLLPPTSSSSHFRSHFLSCVDLNSHLLNLRGQESFFTVLFVFVAWHQVASSDSISLITLTTFNKARISNTSLISSCVLPFLLLDSGFLTVHESILSCIAPNIKLCSCHQLRVLAMSLPNTVVPLPT